MVRRWSKTPASNATADPIINWAEGMPPSAVNDSSRSEMARVAQWRDDISGVLATTGTGTAYAVSSNQGFDTFAGMDGALIAFTPHTSNTGPVTLNVDGLGARNIRYKAGFDGELQAGSLIAGTPYLVKYDNTATVMYLINAGFQTYGIPLGAGLDYWLATAPSSAFAFPIGQAISRTTFSTLFAAMGTTFGIGDGSTTFNLPDLRGRFAAVADNMGGPGPGRLPGYTFAAVGGAYAVSIGQGNLPNVSLSGPGVSLTGSGTTSTESAPHGHPFSGTTGGMNANNPHNHGTNAVAVPQGGPPGVPQNQSGWAQIQTAASNVAANIEHGHPFSGATGAQDTPHTHTVSISGTTSALSVSLGGGGAGLVTIPPSIACNYILRVI